MIVTRQPGKSTKARVFPALFKIMESLRRSGRSGPSCLQHAGKKSDSGCRGQASGREPYAGLGRENRPEALASVPRPEGAPCRKSKGGNGWSRSGEKSPGIPASGAENKSNYDGNSKARRKVPGAPAGSKPAGRGGRDSAAEPKGTADAAGRNAAPPEKPFAGCPKPLPARMAKLKGTV
jgi:hypothetical protein